MNAHHDESPHASGLAADGRTVRSWSWAINCLASAWRDGVPELVKRVLAVGYSLALFPGLFVAAWRVCSVLEQDFGIQYLPRLPASMLPTWSDGTIRNFGIGICLFGALCGLNILRLIPTKFRIRHYRWLALSGITAPWMPIMGIGILVAFVIRYWPASIWARSGLRQRGGLASDEWVSQGESPDLCDAVQPIDGSTLEYCTTAEDAAQSRRWIDARPKRVRRIVVLICVLALLPVALATTTAVLEEKKVIEYTDDAEWLPVLHLVWDRSRGYESTLVENPDLESVYLVMLYSIWAVTAIAVVGTLFFAAMLFRSQNRQAGRYRTTAMTVATIGYVLALWWFHPELGNSLTVKLAWSLL